jgi:hypothetical protein
MKQIPRGQSVPVTSRNGMAYLILPAKAHPFIFPANPRSIPGEYMVRMLMLIITAHYRASHITCHMNTSFRRKTQKINSASYAKHHSCLTCLELTPYAVDRTFHQSCPKASSSVISSPTMTPFFLPRTSPILRHPHPKFTYSFLITATPFGVSHSF